MSSQDLKPQIQYSTPPPVMPEKWASAYGQDSYGYWCAFEFEGIEQRFRWIHPGKFWMGSSEDEKERNFLTRETLHRVSLTKGYWLAETACTQVLWQAVMGDNPSQFKGENNLPVDSVSWADGQSFINKLNRAVPELSARLPTEAEWEYACRAGTTTPFYFGENITPDQVNYNGEHPYAGGKKGLNRQQAVPVASLPCNDWGLYEMHGNVWEWCSDGYQKDLGGGEQVDPQGPALGDDRALRGGSWIGYARYCRSADRDWFALGDADGYIGLRLSRG